MADLFEMLDRDVRFVEGLKGCINCGTCTAICPAAQVSDYDPRQIADIVQHRNQDELIELLKSDLIWLCGECLSCKTRCPRGNTPGYIIQALRAISVDNGYFTESLQGQKQLAIKRTVGEHILKYGYCVHIDEMSNYLFPEQGPVWKWLRQNRESVLKRLKCNYNGLGKGTLRKTSEASLRDLNEIFKATGATERFEKLEYFSKARANMLNIDFSEGHDDYFNYLYNEK